MKFIGDVHGKYARYKNLIKKSKDTIQVGDMGVGFRKLNGDCHDSNFHVNPPYDRMVEGNHRFIRGNHDNPTVCKNHSQCIDDGHVEGDMMFIGGAVSIDRAFRQEGYNWWADEELSHKELINLTDKYIQVKPRIMVTHTCPEFLTSTMAYAANRGEKLTGFPSVTQQAFDGMIYHHRPELWIFGHWHVDFDSIIDGTRYICLDELSTIDIFPDDLSKGGISPRTYW